eukprot:TRINITY_DN4272_c0_g1_i2.p1 TRINITY_DN4272_c0_g1~~TRINITY_DN4272_c0_g1_i2.p1  ORF type:complete len:357 (-),score=50.57 TRINITY_DN4272_c0_g1_i2:413-1366(-)
MKTLALFCWVAVLVMANALASDASRSMIAGSAGIPGMMKYQSLSDYPTALCNDGSPAGYYVRPGFGSGKSTWVVLLEGGWLCFSEETCAKRYVKSPSLMSSKAFEDTLLPIGIQSMDPIANPYLYSANQVFVSYCSSDFWTGNTTEGDGTFVFLGTEIVRSVFDDLSSAMSNADTVVLTGDSAGGIGVIQNADRVATYIPQSAEYFAFADSGFFQANAVYAAENCSTYDTCPMPQADAYGFALWNATSVDACVDALSAAGNDTSMCLVGSVAYPYITSNLLIFQWQFDLAQLTFDNAVTAPLSKNETLYWFEVQDEG